jgi:hypothetical protein
MMENEEKKEEIHSPKDAKSSNYVLESDVSKEFDEVDSENPETILRTIENFELYLKDTNELISFDDIEHYKGNVAMRGFVVMPIPDSVKDKILNILTAVPIDLVSGDDTTKTDGKDCVKPDSASSSLTSSTSTMSSSSSSATSLSPDQLKLDWSTLKVGDPVDGYCNKTFRWYEAKITQYDESKQRYRVHFQGWNSKYDEWIDKYSDRLIPYKTSAIAMKEAEQMASQMIPWYIEPWNYQRHLSSLFPHNPSLYSRKVTQAVILENIDDFCIDYTYPNPTLWIISATTGIWYRIAGALCLPNGAYGYPAPSYAPLFSLAREKYFTCAHIVMALMDILPNHPSANFKMIIDEVSARTSHLNNELIILDHYQFIIEQLSTVENPSDWNHKVSLSSNHFLNQLQKEGIDFELNGGFEAIRNKSYKGPSAKRRLPLLLELENAQKQFLNGSLSSSSIPASALSRSKKRKSIEGLSTLSVGSAGKKSTIGKIEYPMEDQLLLDSTPFPPFPFPSNSDQFLSSLSSSDETSRYSFQEMFLFIYNALYLYQPILSSIPLISIVDLERLLVPSSSVGTPLREIILSLLIPVLKKSKFKFLSYKSSTLSSLTSSDNMLDDEKKVEIRWNLPEIPSNIDNDHLLSYLSQGDTYLEIMKLLIDRSVESSSSSSSTSVIPEWSKGFSKEYNDIYLLCEVILQELDMKFNTSLFSFPLDPTLHNLPNYGNVISDPIDLGTIKSRFYRGYYHRDSKKRGRKAKKIAAEQSEAQVYRLNGSPNSISTSTSYRTGQIIDVYNDKVLRWMEASVVDRQNDEFDCPASYLIRYVGLGTESDEWIAVEENRLLPYKAASTDRTRRVLSPDEFLEKYPSFTNAFDDGDDDDGDDDDTEEETQHEELSAEGDKDDRKSLSSGYVRLINDIRQVFTNCITYYQASDDYQENDIYQEAILLLSYYDEQLFSRIFPYLSDDEVSSFDWVDENLMESLFIHRNQPHFSNTRFYKYDYSLKKALSSQMNKTGSSNMETEGTSSVVEEEKPNEDYLASSENYNLIKFSQEYSTQSFASMRTEGKITILHWLIMEFLSTDAAEEFSSKLAAMKTPSSSTSSTATDAVLSAPSTSSLAQIVETLDEEYKEKVKKLDEETDGGEGKGKRKRKSLLPTVEEDSLLVSDNENGEPKSKRRKSSVKSLSVPDEGSADIFSSPSGKGDTGKPPLSTAKKGKPSVSADENLEDDRESQVSEHLSSSKKGSTRLARSSSQQSLTVASDNGSVATTGEKGPPSAVKKEAIAVTDPQLLNRSIRIKPLGKDRYGNNYWTFSHEVIQPMIYCEFQITHALLSSSSSASSVSPRTPTSLNTSSPRSSQFLAFSHPADILSLLYWLKEDGINELLLIRNIFQWILSNYFPQSIDSTSLEQRKKELKVIEGEEYWKEMAATKMKHRKKQKELYNTYEMIVKMHKIGFEKVFEKIQSINAFPKENLPHLSSFVGTFPSFNQLNKPIAAVIQKIDDYLDSHFSPSLVISSSTNSVPSVSPFSSFSLPLLPDDATKGYYCLFSVNFEEQTEKALGMGVRGLNGGKAVYIINFRENSVAKKLGLMIGDRLIYTSIQTLDKEENYENTKGENSAPQLFKMDSVSQLQFSIKEAIAASNRITEENNSNNNDEKPLEGENDSQIARRMKEKKESATKEHKKSIFYLLVHRCYQPRKDIYFSDLLEKEKDISLSLSSIEKANSIHLKNQKLELKQQILLSNSFSSLSTPILPLNNSFSSAVYSSALTLLLSLIETYFHPASLSSMFRESIYPDRVKEIIQLLASTCSSFSPGHEHRLFLLLLTLLQEFEQDLFDFGTIVTKEWLENEDFYRSEWKTLLSSSLSKVLSLSAISYQGCFNSERLCYLVVIFKELAIDSSLYRQLTIPIYSSLSSSVAVNGEENNYRHILAGSRNIPIQYYDSILKKGNKIIFYEKVFQDFYNVSSTNYFQYFPRLSQSSSKVCQGRNCYLWGSTYSPSSSSSLFCEHSLSPRVFQIDSFKVYNSLIPFIQLTITEVFSFENLLYVYHSSSSKAVNLASSCITPSSCFPIPKILSLSSTLCRKYSLSRKLEKVFMALKKNGMFKIFYEPVNNEEYPDYLSIIKKPMDFTKIQKKLSSFKYDCYSSFEADILLILSNCVLYCGENHKYVTLANQLVEECQSLAWFLFPEEKEDIEKDLNERRKITRQRKQEQLQQEQVEEQEQVQQTEEPTSEVVEPHSIVQNGHTDEAVQETSEAKLDLGDEYVVDLDEVMEVSNETGVVLKKDDNNSVAESSSAMDVVSENTDDITSFADELKDDENESGPRRKSLRSSKNNFSSPSKEKEKVTTSSLSVNKPSSTEAVAAVLPPTVSRFFRCFFFSYLFCSPLSLS